MLKLTHTIQILAALPNKKEGKLLKSLPASATKKSAKSLTASVVTRLQNQHNDFKESANLAQEQQQRPQQPRRQGKIDGQVEHANPLHEASNHSHWKPSK